MHDYLIVGAGLFGAVFAQQATEKGKTCLIVEKRSHIAGNCYTEESDGINVHRYGAHIFHTSYEKVWEYINRFADFNNYINSPIANYNGEIFNLPFNMNTFNKMWGTLTPAEVQQKIKEQCSEINGEPRNLEEQAISLVGKDIYEKLIKGYTEKQWGRSCKDLPASIIKRLPVRFTYDNNYFNDKYQGIPIGGYTALIEKMLSGCDVVLNCDFNKNRDELTKKAKKIIYTGTIDSYFDYSLGALEYRSLCFEDKVCDCDNYQGVAVVNYTDENTPYTRVIEHKHFEFMQGGKSVITYEYPQSWNKENEPYYPVNDVANAKLYEEYKTLAESEKNVYFCGRLGEYKYYDMDDTILAALEFFEEL